MNLADLPNLIPGIEFIDGVLEGKYEFSTDEWSGDAEDHIQFGKGITEYQKNFPRCKLFFQVDPEDNTSATLVLEIPDDLGAFWEAFNEFIKAFGAGDTLEAQSVPDAEAVYFFSWYD